MSGPTTFSYAQAAKGHVTTPASAQPTNVQPESHAKDDASSVTTGPDAAAATFSTASEVSESAKSSQIDMEVVGTKKTSEIAGDLDAPPASIKDDSSSAVRDETAKTNGLSTTEKSTRQSNRSSEAADSKKGRKGRKGRSSEKEVESEQATAEPEKEVEPVKLTEALPPAVNVWVQRAAAAKARSPPAVDSALAGAESSSKTGAEAAKAAKVPEAHNTDTVRGNTKSTDIRQLIDQPARRNPRGNRANDKTEQSSETASAVEDVSSWPTPETAAAAEDGKRKPSEADQTLKDKIEDGNKSIRQKRDWKKVEITPSVVFNTPLPQPRTINKARGGGQASRSSASRGHGPSSSISGDKGQVSVTPEVAPTKDGAEPQARPREDAPSRGAPVPSEKNKRFSVDQQNQRKQSVPALNRGTGSNDYPSKNDASKAPKAESAQVTRGDGPDNSRKEGGFSGHKEPKPRRGGAHGNGRGGHNGQQLFASNGHGGPRSSTFSPSNFGSGFPPNQYGGSNRGGRGRPVSVSNGFKGPANGAPKMHQHPQSASADFGQYSSFGHGPYPLQPEYTNPLALVHEALRKQVEYYFSEANLVKDGFLRAHMDAQGFVPLEVIAQFRRISQIGGQIGGLYDQRNLLRQACADSKDIDYVLGDGHKELVRVRENWQRWLSESESKDASEAPRNPGPTNLEFRSFDRVNNYYPHQQHSVSYNPAYTAMSPPAFGPPAFPGDMYPGYMNGPRFPPAAINGTQVNGHAAADNSPLNASVPEFSPVYATSSGQHNAFTSIDWTEQAIQAAQTISDEEVAKLHMVVQGKMTSSKESGKLTNGTTNGNEDGTALKPNGVHIDSDTWTTPDMHSGTEGPTSPTYSRLDGTHAQVSDANNLETYVDVHDRAVEQRRLAKQGDVPDDMKRLYKFWAHYLMANFNPGMYKEFRQFALDDMAAETPNKAGLSNLLYFYKNVLSKREGTVQWPIGHPIYQVLQQHYDEVQGAANGNQGQA